MTCSAAPPNASLAGFAFSLSGSTLTYTGGSLTLSNFAGRLSASAAAGGGVELTLNPRAAANDFNGDGRSDVLWRHSSGLVTDWLGTAEGGFLNNHAAAATSVANDWTIAGTADFNGDRRGDLMWRHVSVQISDWLGTATGGFVNNHANAARILPPVWPIIGTGDFNGDGRDDFLIRHDTGALTVYLGQANGSFENNGHNMMGGTVGRDWVVAGIGDYNGDGRGDLLWRHSGGSVSEWLALRLAGSSTITPMPRQACRPTGRSSRPTSSCTDRGRRVA